MARGDFTIIEAGGPHGVAIGEATSAIFGSDPASGSSSCLAIALDGSLSAAEGRGFTYSSLSVENATSDIYLLRNASGVGFGLLGRADGSTDLAAYTGYMAALNSNGSGAVALVRYAAGTPTAVASTPAAFSPAVNTWERWRLYLRTAGADVVYRIEKWTGATWSTVLSGIDTGSPLAGVPGRFGFAVFDIAGGSTYAGPSAGFDDWRCDEAVAP